MAIGKLIFANMKLRRVRTILTILAIAISVSLVGAVSTGVETLHAASQRFLDQMLGSADAVLTRQGGGTYLEEDAIGKLTADPQVQSIDRRLELRVGLTDAHGKPVPGPPSRAVGIQIPGDAQVANMRMDQGAWFGPGDGAVVVIDQFAAERMNVKLGDTIGLTELARHLDAKIVGIIYKPSLFARQSLTLYLPLSTLQKFSRNDGASQVTRVGISLREGADEQAFVDRWTPRLHEIDPNLRLKASTETRQDLESKLYGIRVFGYLAGSVALLAAGFIVFASLGMGVMERQRQLAMLRSIGATRGQLAMLVLAEGLILVICGVIIGAPLGWLWIKLLSMVPAFAHGFLAGVQVDLDGMALGCAGCIVASMMASFFPAWQAMRVDPLKAMAPLATPPPSGIPIKWTIIGLLLICIEPALMLGPMDWLAARIWEHPPIQALRIARLYGHFAIGLPTVMIGFFLVAPMLVWVIEQVVGPLMAILLRIPQPMLRQQLTNGIWRSAGTCAAMMVGLAILIVTQTHGNTILSGMKLPDRFPDVFIASDSLFGLSPGTVQKLGQMPEIRRNSRGEPELMPIAIASAQFGGNMFAIAGMAVMPDATMFFGVDPDHMRDMIGLDYREGNADEAAEMLKKGRHAIVTEEFQELEGLHVGDTFKLKTFRNGVQEYTIAGVVWSPAIDVIVSRYDMNRQVDQRTATSIFGSLDDARQDFGAENIYLAAANLTYGVQREQLVRQMQKELGIMGMSAYDTRHIKAEIVNTFSRVMILVTVIGLSSMLVASLGVTNTLMVSIRSRQWQFGVLRSIGLTRWQMSRLIIGEAIMLSIVGCAMGVAVGMILAASGGSLLATVFGLHLTMVVPWAIVLLACLGMVLLAVLASLWPAISVARREPLRLLAAGRAAA